MSKTKSNARPQDADANKTGIIPQGTPSHPFTLDSDEVKAPLARMIEATIAEAKARDDAEAAVTGAAANTWGILRDATLELVKVAGPKVAGEALDAYKGQAAIIGGRTKARANQYASDLRRAIKAADKGKTLPAELLTAGRSAWNDSTFWQDAGVTTKRGTQAPDATTSERAAAEVNGGPASTGPASVHAGAVADAIAKAAEDAGWQELTTLYSGLHGPFRAEAFASIKAELLRISAKQEAAATGTR